MESTGTTISPLASQKELSQNWLEKVLSHKLAKDVKINSWTVNSPEKKDGFCSEIGFVKAFYTAAGGPEEERDLVVKFMPENEEFVKMMMAGNIPTREKEFYKYTASEHFRLFCQRVGIKHPVPDVYWAELKEEKLTIVLDDLKAKGYKSSTPPEGISLNQVKNTLRSIAVIHASGVTNRKDNEFCNLKSPWDPSYFEEYVKTGLEMLIQMHNELPLADTFKALLKFSSDMITISHKHPFINTYVHGDLWAGNVMFSDSDKSACILDWQVAHIGNPLCDVASLLLMSTEPSVYVDHLAEVVECYWQSYQEALQRNEVPVSVSLQDIVKNLESLWIHGLMCVSASLPFLLDHSKMTEQRVKAMVSFLEKRGAFENFLQSCV